LGFSGACKKILENKKTGLEINKPQLYKLPFLKKEFYFWAI